MIFSTETILICEIVKKSSKALNLIGESFSFKIAPNVMF